MFTMYKSNHHIVQLYLTKVEEMEKEMATHSSIFPWEISWSEESGGLWSKESQRVRDDLATKQEQQRGKK